MADRNCLICNGVGLWHTMTFVGNEDIKIIMPGGVIPKEIDIKEEYRKNIRIIEHYSDCPKCKGDYVL